MGNPNRSQNNPENFFWKYLKNDGRYGRSKFWHSRWRCWFAGWDMTKFLLSICGPDPFGILDGAADLCVEIWPKFFCQFSSHVIEICWKFQWDISNGFWIIINLLKNSGYHLSKFSKFLLKVGGSTELRRMSTRIF